MVGDEVSTQTTNSRRATQRQRIREVRRDLLSGFHSNVQITTLHPCILAPPILCGFATQQIGVITAVISNIINMGRLILSKRSMRLAMCAC